MKTNQNQTCRPATALARLTFILTLALWLGGLPSLLAQAVPDRLNYQGILLDGQGAPVTAVTDVEFRIWDTPTSTDQGGLKWGRMFKITPDINGAFNVVLSGEGSVLSDAPDTSLTSVFTGTGSDSRYLELKVKDSTPISPRQRFVASPYAFLANGLTDAARQNFTVSDTLAVPVANVGTLTASGAANVGSLTSPGAVTAASFTGSGAGLTGINTNSLVQQVVEALCPPGTIVAFGGTTIPAGWLLCDGTNVSRTTYTRLFSAISTNWGSADSSHFNLPDLRGMFLRGVNLAKTGAYADPNTNSRAVSATGGASGNAVGSIQQDALQNVTGTIGDLNTWAALRGTHDGPFSLGTTWNSQGVSSSSNNDPWGTLKMDLSKAAGVRTSSETRPINAYVNYIIKY